MTNETYTVYFSAGYPEEVETTSHQYAYLIAVARRLERGGENGEVSYVIDTEGNRRDDIKIHVTN